MGVRVNHADRDDNEDLPVAPLSLIAFVFSSRQTFQFAASKDLGIKASDCESWDGVSHLRQQYNKTLSTVTLAD